MRQEIKSIGIDIGTSTTQLVFSRIVVENVAGSYNAVSYTHLTLPTTERV